MITSGCITGGTELGVRNGAVKSEPEVGAQIQQVSSQLIVGRLGSILV